MNVTSQLTVDLDKSVKSFWELKSFEINETNDSSSESEKAIQIFDSSIIPEKDITKCYFLGKKEKIELCDSYKNTLKEEIENVTSKEVKV
ncbi:hypothetical protein TNIN_258231 [Trichonephila inaurata madagascariensis]|uniref:Uncharacterized protein n=1 Tax=Trichonephila inaurata madagascariensis TaxID=2747483 RepID=A0A8X6WQE3_9ARAC|nr:hypothetical protein TNIN_258231 [Trichonephila inaurata madagascariensis]